MPSILFILQDVFVNIKRTKPTNIKNGDVKQIVDIITDNGNISADNPKISNVFVIQEPTELPIAILLKPFLEAVIATDISGIVVPIATKTPITVV